MAAIQENVDLRGYNTFGIQAKCRYFCEISSLEGFGELMKTSVYRHEKRLILGGGSNVLFLGDFKGLVIKVSLKGIRVLEENDNSAVVEAYAGELWHDLVQFCIMNRMGGLENLSLIPGCVGASPMQNIGAYGVEIKDRFLSLEAVDLTTGQRRTFSREQCNFGYRESYFKREGRDKYLITKVNFQLSKNPTLNTSYGAINQELEARGVSKPTIKDVSEAVIRIRQSKLPDPAVLGNAGSFFKNPEVDEEKYQSLKQTYPALVAYPTAGHKYKLAAGWLIEQCGLKGKKMGGAMVHTKQALVLVNTGNATGSDVLNLSGEIQQTVKEKFGVMLEREVNVVE